MKTNYIKTSDKSEAVKLINKIRLNNKDSWYYIDLIYNNKVYQIKAFGTWLQIFRLHIDKNMCCIESKLPCFDYSNCMDQTIKQFKQHITNVLD